MSSQLWEPLEVKTPLCCIVNPRQIRHRMIDCSCDFKICYECSIIFKDLPSRKFGGTANYIADLHYNHKPTCPVSIETINEYGYKFVEQTVLHSEPTIPL